MKKVLAIILSFLLVFSIVLINAEKPEASSGVERIDVIIGFTGRPGPAETALVIAAGGHVKFVYSIIPSIAASLPQKSIEGLLRNPKVTVIEPDVEIFAIGTAEELSDTWGVERIRAGEVHAAGNTGTGVKVAVIDSGIDYNHPELASNYVEGYDFFNGDSDPMDDNGHGTHVAGTIAALRNGAGVVGVAPEVRLYAFKVLGSNGSGSFSNVIMALQKAMELGIQVTNNSYGSTGDPGIQVKAAFDNAYAAGIIHVASAGNSGTVPGNKDTIGYPAKYDSVVAVTAVDSANKRPSWSSTGPAAEIAAPGVSIKSTYLNGGYALMSGTSMASPHVAGAAALLISAGANSPSEVRRILADTAVYLGNESWYGKGLVDVYAACSSLQPSEPSVNVLVTSDKSEYREGTDTQAVITVTVADEYDEAISGLGSGAFSAVLNGAPYGNIIFDETAVNGVYEGSVDLTALDEGTYVISVAVTDARNITGASTAGFTLLPASSGTDMMAVERIAYALSGGKLSDRHLAVTVYVVDNARTPVSGASVTFTLYRGTIKVLTASGVTNSAGAVTATYNNAPSGSYTTDVDNVTKDGYIWDGITPANEITK